MAIVLSALRPTPSRRCLGEDESATAWPVLGLRSRA